MRLALPLVLLLPACAGTESPLLTGSTTESSSGSETSGNTDSDPQTPTSTTEPTPTGTDVTPTTIPGDDSTSSSDEGGDPGTDTSTGSSSTGDESSSSTGPALPDCSDGALNQDETDVDCGGSICEPCGPDGACQQDIDCVTTWCDAGVCTLPGCLVDADCDELDGVCHAASCDAATKSCALTPINEGGACESGDLCQSGETCSDGACGGGTTTDCSALDSTCGAGVCDPQTGACVGDALPGSEGDVCDDGFVCTPNDSCVAGLCGAGGPGYLFFEDFSDPDPAWELGPLWAIGAAVASPEGPSGADPADDHSPGADDKLAGTLIGGLIPVATQAKTCLTSPEIDASGQDELWLSYWRHLHTDYFPFVVHTIEAFDGADWQVVETGFANPGVNDPAWTYQTHDITDYANPELRVRICYARDEEAFIHAGWSLDDLTVGPFACTPEP